MAEAIRVPDVGTNVDEVKIVSWQKQPGDRVETGEVIAEIETDKAVVELEATADGYLISIEVPAGDTAGKGDVLAYIGEKDEKAPGPPAERKEQKGIPEKKPAGKKDERGAEIAVKASPLVRNIARGKSIDLSGIRGTGPGGRIVRDDLLRYEQEEKPAEIPSGRQFELTDNQKRVAEKVSRSNREIPTTHFRVRVDMTAAMAFRNGSLSTLKTKPGYDSLFIYAVSRVLKDYPLVNSAYEGNRIKPGENINVGFALGIGNELYIPVVKKAADKTAGRIDDEVSSLIRKGKSGKLGVEDMSGGTFLISNLGMYPVHEFDAIIPPGYGCALAIGSIFNEPVVYRGGIRVCPVANMILSADHRLINGRLAAEFLAALKQFLETAKFD